MQQRTDPGRIGPRWGQVDWGVNGPIGKSGTNRGGRRGSSDPVSQNPRRARDSSSKKRSRIGDATEAVLRSRSRARATPCWIRRRLKPSRRAIDRRLSPRRWSSSQRNSRASTTSLALKRCTGSARPGPPDPAETPTEPPSPSLRVPSIALDLQPPGRGRNLRDIGTASGSWNCAKFRNVRESRPMCLPRRLLRQSRKIAGRAIDRAWNAAPPVWYSRLESAFWVLTDDSNECPPGRVGETATQPGQTAHPHARTPKRHPLAFHPGGGRLHVKPLTHTHAKNAPSEIGHKGSASPLLTMKMTPLVRPFPDKTAQFSWIGAMTRRADAVGGAELRGRLGPGPLGLRQRGGVRSSGGGWALVLWVSGTRGGRCGAPGAAGP